MSEAQKGFLSAVIMLLIRAHQWAERPELGVMPEALRRLIRDAHSAADAGPLPLSIAVDQVFEDFRGFEAQELESRQPDDSPAPRFWGALKLVAQRTSELIESTRLPQMQRTFEFRRLQHSARFSSPEFDLEDFDEPTDADLRMMEEAGAT